MHGFLGVHQSRALSQHSIEGLDEFGEWRNRDSAEPGVEVREEIGSGVGVGHLHKVDVGLDAIIEAVEIDEMDVGGDLGIFQACYFESSWVVVEVPEVNKVFCWLTNRCM